MRSSTRSGRSALVALSVALAACGGYTGPEPVVDADGCPVVGFRGVYASTVFPAGSFDDIATFGDQVSVFTVTGERRGELDVDGTGWVPRWVTIRIDEMVWAAPRAADPDSGVGLEVGDELEILTWPSAEGDECIAIESAGNPTLRPGHRYVGASSFDLGEHGLFPGATAVLDDDGTLALRAELLDGLAEPSDYGTRMATATPDPIVADQMWSDPSERMEALSAYWTELDPPPPTDATGNTFPP